MEILHTYSSYVPRNNIIIVTFYPNGCSQFENPEAPDFEKIASASSFFSTLSLPSPLPLPTSFIKVLFRFRKKLTASTFLIRTVVDNIW